MAAQTAIRAEILEDLEKLSEQRLSEVRDLVHALVASETPQILRFAADDPLGDVRRPGTKPRVVAASPEEALDEIRALLSEGRITEARNAALDAAQRFPEHAALRDAKTILCDGKARAGSYCGPLG